MLRAPDPTSSDEICRCDAATPIKLMTALGFNPLHCVACNLKVPPERIGLTSRLADALARWNSIADAIDRLWLDSGAYEEWARAQLSDSQSPVNIEGRRLTEQLNELCRCFYWCFVDEETKGGLNACPICDGPFLRIPSEPCPSMVCEQCSLIAPALEEWQ